MVDFIVGHFNYWVIITLMMTGLYVIISTGNLVKKLVGLGVFQTSVFQLYITLSKVAGGRPPIFDKLPGYGTETKYGAAVDPLLGVIYSNPLPHVLILTAIVVGVSTLAVGLALVVRIREAYGSIEGDDIDEAEYKIEIASS
ncbi:MAG: cation:proton antiporter subunit C [Robiginitomaculum sp.]|nr:cation:proton antiporter subunit C [Robiginitomaculum sp.]